jgi:3-hydroxybutyryl-CoA dehydrogenase
MLKVNVLGYGQMGRQIASLLGLIGCDVAIWNRSIIEEVYVLRQLKLVSKLLDIPMNACNIKVVSSFDSLHKSAITIEVLTEDINIKKEILNLCKDRLSGELYTNTSSYSPLEIGEGVGGLHFFNPITLRLIEFFRPTSPENNSIEKLIALLEKYEFTIFNVNPNRGYLANSLLFREISNVFFMIEQSNYSLDAIDRVYESFHKNRSIFDVVDLVGVDTSYVILENLKFQDGSIYLPKSLRSAVQKNILGKKNKTSIRKFLEDKKVSFL